VSSTVTLGVIGASIVLVVLFEMLRRQRLREKYALIWFVVAVVTVVVAIFPRVLLWAADLLGVQVPANLLFFLASMLLLLLSVQFSYEIGRLEERTRTLAEEVALLRLEIERQAGPPDQSPQPDPLDVPDPPKEA
jgi:hypothetical protein